MVEHNSIKKYGLASVFSITCAVCGTENVVKTSSEHRSSQRGPNSHDDNSRAALLYLHTGISETHLNNLLCTLNIPSMNPVTFKSRENEIGQAVKQVTKKSWQKQEKGHNSSTDQAAVMGLTYRKVMDYTTRTKSCTVCTNVQKNWKRSQKHNFRLNHTASSKAMKSTAAVHLFTVQKHKLLIMSNYPFMSGMKTQYQLHI